MEEKGHQYAHRVGGTGGDDNEQRGSSGEPLENAVKFSHHVTFQLLRYAPTDCILLTTVIVYNSGLRCLYTNNFLWPQPYCIQYWL